jgi:hypothetical protein
VKAAKATTGRKRPVAVTLVGLLALAAGLYHLVGGGLTVAEGHDASKLAEGVFDVAFGVFALAIGRGAFRMAPWAWAAFMTWAVIGLTHQLLRHFFYDDQSYAMLAVDTLVVLVLTPLAIQVAFGVRSRPSLDLDGGAYVGSGDL